MHLHWMIIAMSVIILLAVGSDYNLLLVSRFKEEIHAGTTIGLGLLFDTLVIRSFMTPSIAALLGKWFWWPQRVRQRPVPAPWPAAKTEAEPEAVGATPGRHASDESPTGP